MPKIHIDKKVDLKIKDLINALYYKGYFGFMDTCIEYALNIFDFIETIPDLKRKLTANQDLGKYYASYKANKQTTWYIIYDTDEEVFIIRNIFNNHEADYADYI